MSLEEKEHEEMQEKIDQLRKLVEANYTRWKQENHQNLESAEIEKNQNLEEIHSVTEQDWILINDPKLLYLRRYLLATNLDVPAAYKRLLKTLEWRNTFRPHEISKSEVDWQMKTGKAKG